MISWLAYEGRGVRLIDLAKAFGINPKTVERLRDQYQTSLHQCNVFEPSFARFAQFGGSS